jgi:hypothetical protein
MTTRRDGGYGNPGDGWTYDYITRTPEGVLRLFSQDLHVDEDGVLVAAERDPRDLTDAVDSETLRQWAEAWDLDPTHGNPDDCLVDDGETLVAHKLTANPELDRGGLIY